mgnify:CR=1 FL=1
MKKVKIKICGVREIATIDCCIDNNVEYFGLVFFEKSVRNINLELALKLINYVNFKDITPVGVFVNKPINDLRNIIKRTRLNHVQLHGNENDDYISILKKEFNIKVVKSVGIKKKADLKKIEELSNADYLLFDYKPEINDLPGGNAKKFDWSLLQHIKINKPWFISGGINISNIEEIDKNLIPYGIDISSGVEEKPGIKSLNKITKLLEKLNVK